MSKNKNIKQQVSNFTINVNKINNISNYSSNSIRRYNEFCSKILNEDLYSKKILELETLYESGNGLLNEYYLLDSNKIDNDIISKLQFAISTLIYHINKKNSENLSKQLKTQNNTNKTLKTELKMTKSSNRNLKKQMDSIIVTIIAIVLTISIIPTAISGIIVIPPKFILPFVATIILFGMVMILFILSIYRVMIRKSSRIIFISTIIITIILWILCWNVNIEFTPREIESIKIYNDGNV